jgi:hypothetical protein
MSNMDTVEVVPPNANDVTDVEFREVVQEQPDDQPLSIAETITMAMEDAGVVDVMDWMIGIDKEALTSPDLNIQRYLINRHWRGLFTGPNLTKDQIKESINARGCLVDGRWELADWLTHFKKDVIPCAIKVGILNLAPSEKTDSPTSSIES